MNRPVKSVVFTAEARGATNDASTRHTRLLALLLILAAGVRLFGVWQLRGHANSDAGVVALMAKHIATGVDVPVFFYGQPYIGSFEPFVSALCCRLFGVSGFAVGLGTALVGWLMLPVVYAWARAMHSPRAGLLAVAYCAIGPLGYFHYQVSPRGGYTAVLLFGTLVLWLTGRALAREQSNRPPGWGAYALIGLAGGLGWWSNQLIVAALLAAGLMLVTHLGGRLIGVRAWAGVGGFALGSAPFWWWNVTHDWGSFAFLQSFEQSPLSWAQGVKLFFVDRFLDLVDLWDTPPVWRWIGTPLYLAAAAAGLGALVVAVRERRVEARTHLLMLFLFVLISAWLFSKSHYALMGTPRYLLPLVPVAAALLGLLTAGLTARAPWPLGWAPLGALLVWQYQAFPWAAERRQGEADVARQVGAVAAALHSNGVEAVYAPYGHHWWNFALDETLPLSDLPVDRYPPYTRRAERADVIAVLDNHGDVTAFLSGCGGRAETNADPVLTMHRAFSAPAGDLMEIPPAQIAAIEDSEGHDARAQVTDRQADTFWESRAPDDDDEWLAIAFTRPTTVCAVRLLFLEYPPDWQIVGRTQDGEWRPLTERVARSGWFWSGPRPYWEEWLYRLEARFEPMTVTHLRVQRIGNRFGLRECQVFGPAAPTVSEADALPSLTAELRRRGIERLYCDRWVAIAVARAEEGQIQTPLHPFLFETGLSSNVVLTPHTGLAVKQGDAALCREALAARLIALRETAIGPWMLFDVAPDAWREDYARDACLLWVGYGCLLTREKHWAAELVARADVWSALGRGEKAIALLLRADRSWPRYGPVAERLADGLREAGRAAEADDWAVQAAALARPRHPADIRFVNGLVLRGVTLSAERVKAGESVTLRYYWHTPPGVEPKPWAFVHFESGTARFQDDHPVPHFPGEDDQPLEDEPFVEERTMVVSASAPPGRYVMKIGLYQPARKGRRLAVSTALPVARQAVTLPVSLDVTP